MRKYFNLDEAVKAGIVLAPIAGALSLAAKLGASGAAKVGTAAAVDPATLDVVLIALFLGLVGAWSYFHRDKS